MPNKLVEYFRQIHPMNDVEAQAIEDSMVLKLFKKGTVLLSEGQVSTECYFVWEGLCAPILFGRRGGKDQ